MNYTCISPGLSQLHGMQLNTGGNEALEQGNHDHEETSCYDTHLKMLDENCFLAKPSRVQW